MVRTTVTEMILQAEATSSCPVLTALSAKEKIVEASRTIIIPNVVGMRFCTGSSFSCEIKAEIFSALLTEFKKVLVQNCATDITMTNLHTFVAPSFIEGES